MFDTIEASRVVAGQLPAATPNLPIATFRYLSCAGMPTAEGSISPNKVRYIIR